MSGTTNKEIFVKIGHSIGAVFDSVAKSVGLKYSDNFDDNRWELMKSGGMRSVDIDSVFKKEAEATRRNRLLLLLSVSVMVGTIARINMVENADIANIEHENISRSIMLTQKQKEQFNVIHGFMESGGVSNKAKADTIKNTLDCLEAGGVPSVTGKEKPQVTCTPPATENELPSFLPG